MPSLLSLVGWLLDSLCTLTCLVLFPTFSPSSVSPSLMPQGSGHTGKDSSLSLLHSLSFFLAFCLSLPAFCLHFSSMYALLQVYTVCLRIQNF
ncbi:hypothetical protein CEXT_402281 [Caerostris extrusa]|uniref:Secreted protein n=1 Tax=Caerostris extrusa TaxID=172846 RepID=A0AAV4PKB8_CAEEX|nr:hypothetical protein CEXT_402281 [Caerostris extrusa]